MRRAGFTLLELLLSVSMIAVLTSVVIPFSRSYYTKNGLALATESDEQALRQAESYARGQVHDTEWGVYATTGHIVVFSGSSYATRNTDLDISFDISNNIGVSGTTEIVFAKLTALPSSSGTTTFTDVDGKIGRVDISAQGIVRIE